MLPPEFVVLAFNGCGTQGSRPYWNPLRKEFIGWLAPFSWPAKCISADQAILVRPDAIGRHALFRKARQVSKPASDTAKQGINSQQTLPIESDENGAGSWIFSRSATTVRPHQILLQVTTSSAMDAVINTPELLECILLHLDLRTLLTAGLLVSRHWNVLIVSSPSLQQALFFLPIEGRETTTPRLNPLLRSAFPCFFHSTTAASTTHPNSAIIPSLALAQVLPARNEMFTRPSASWRRMLVSQPPPSELCVWTTPRATDCVPDSARLWEAALVEGFGPAGGLRMGALYERGMGWLARGAGAVRVFWDVRRLGGKPDIARAESARKPTGREVDVSLRFFIAGVRSRACMIEEQEFMRRFGFPRGLVMD